PRCPYQGPNERTHPVQSMRAASAVTSESMEPAEAAVSGAEELTLRSPPVERAAQALLRVLWLTLIPALAAAVVLRYWVPTLEEAHNPWLEGFTRFAGGQSLRLGIALFLLFGWLARYWRFSLPGGRFLSGLPAGIAARLPHAHIAIYARGSDALRALAR